MCIIRTHNHYCTPQDKDKDKEDKDKEREEEEEEKDPILPLSAKPMSPDWPSALQAQLSVLTNKYVHHHSFYTYIYIYM
jgi:hypothetical protein